MNRRRDRRGVAIRAAIKSSFALRIGPDVLLPKTARVAAALGVSRVQAWKHIRRAMAEAGVELRRTPFGLVVERGRG